MRFTLLVAQLLMISQITFADEYHYKEVLVGERAIGLGGSYIALSDDPSGMWYNPAGIIFSFENYFSLSANAYVVTSEVYKNIVKDKNYTYTSSGLVPNFFGFTQNYDKWKFGFGIVVPNSDLYDQDDEFLDLSSEAGKVNSYSRKFYRQNTTTSIGIAGARELTKNFTMGVATFVNYHVDKTINNQLVIYNANSPNLMNYHVDDAFLSKTVVSLSPKLGIQFMPMPALSMGATLAKKINMSGNQVVRSYKSALNNAGTFPADPTGNTGTDLTRSTVKSTSTDPAPIELGLGVAYFPSKSFLLSGDFTYYTDDPEYKAFNVVSTWNASLGSEYYISEKSAIRTGIFTNNANTPALSSTKANQATHVDMLGLTASYAVSSPGSSFAFGFSYSSGSGKGQAIGGTTTQQDVERQSTSVFLTGSYQM